MKVYGRGRRKITKVIGATSSESYVVSCCYAYNWTMLWKQICRENTILKYMLLHKLKKNRKTLRTSAFSSKFCSVLFFSWPRSEVSPHHERILSLTIYLCPLPFWLTLPLWVLSSVHVLMLFIQAVLCAWSTSPACTWHCFFHYFFLQAIRLFSHGHGVTIGLVC